MAITVSLVAAFPNRLRYLCEADGNPGTTATIPNSAGASPDLRTDTSTFNGPLFQIARASVNGIGQLPAGTRLNQAQARQILVDDGTPPGVGSGVGNVNVPRARCWITNRTNAATVWTVDANADVPGNPILNISLVGQGVASAYLDVIANPAIGGGLFGQGGGQGGGGGTIPG